MNYPFVSVVVVVYNGEQYIKECIQSILNLDYPKDKYELILVDGGSNDMTLNIASEYSIRILHNKRRRIAPGRNLGALNAKGKYIAFTDSDCVVKTDWLTSLITTISFTDKDVVAVGGPNLILDTDPPFAKVVGYMQETFLASGGSPQSYRFKHPKYVISLANCNVIYRKEIICKEKYDDTFNVGEDAELNFRLKKAGYKFLYTPKAIVWHHRRTNLKSFVKNMFSYGVAQAEIILKHKDIARWYSFIPALTIFVLILILLLSLVDSRFLFLLTILTVGYVTILFLSTTKLLFKTKKFSVLFSFVLIPLQHLSYSLGFIRGFI